LPGKHKKVRRKNMTKQEEEKQLEMFEDVHRIWRKLIYPFRFRKLEQAWNKVGHEWLQDLGITTNYFPINDYIEFEQLDEGQQLSFLLYALQRGEEL
jgi:hypothetical protein